MKLSLKIKDIPESGLHLEVPFSGPLLEESLAGTNADLAASHVDAVLDLTRSGNTVSIRGTLAGDAQVACTRCLEEAHLPIAQRLHAVIGPRSIGAEESLGDEIEYFNHDGEVVELEPVLRESLILELPMVVLCRADCQGLCPVCGGNRNQQPCTCEVKVAAPRLSVLKDIKL